MNYINFDNGNGFPLTSDTLKAMQSQSQFADSAALFALLGASNWILSGCEVGNSTISDGIIYWRGELLPFTGGAGTLESGCVVEQIVEQAANRSGQMIDRYFKRVAKFGAGNGFRLKDLQRFESNSLQAQRLAMALQLESIVIISGGQLIYDRQQSRSPIGHSALLALANFRFYAIPETVFTSPSGAIHEIGSETLIFDPDTTQRISAIRLRQSAFVGEIRAIASDLTANFDASGRGLGDYFGWALCNGQNGTIDTRGRVLRGLATNQAIGSRLGADEVRLNIANMPSHHHNQIGYGLIKKSNVGEAVTISSVDASGAGSEPNIIATPVEMTSQGSGEAFSIVPSSISVQYLQRI